MFVVRETFKAKPGKASTLAALFKELFKEIPQFKARVLTDVIAEFNTVVLEIECDDLTQFEKALRETMANPALRDKMKGYTELYIEGRREVYRVF